MPPVDSSSRLPPRLFLYGTLMPGWPRWPIVRPFARTIRVDAVPGRIYDNGEGQAAAVFAPADAGPARAGPVVEGWVVELQPRLAERALRHVGRLEGERYRERVITTVEGADAVTFEWVRSTDGLDELPGRWRDPERRTG